MIAETCVVSVGKGDGQKQSTEELMKLSDALEEADALRVAVSSRDAALRAQVRVPCLCETPAPCNSCRALRKQRTAGFPGFVKRLIRATPIELCVSKGPQGFFASRNACSVQLL